VAGLSEARRAGVSRTYLTAGLAELLVNSLRRLSGTGGDPVVELQVTFGGGKTHSMLALYHLFSGISAADLPGLENVLKESGISQPPAVRRAVLVGNALKLTETPKDDGTVVRTIWGELAYQLGGPEGYAIVRAADETATNPGEALDALFRHCGPCLILIDEWIAYARQLYGREKMLPAGSFDTQFTFAQTLCEAAKRAPNVQVLVSLPYSERQSDEARREQQRTESQLGEAGGIEALARLQQAIGRSNLVWRPAQGEETYEIVRRRLFGPVSDPRHRDAVVKAFLEFYRANRQDFPSECSDLDYERKLSAAYPIHPELFERLYSDWSQLERFQRTRGVLRLLAAVIHSLWRGDDRNVLILPAMVPVGDLQPELTRYLEDRWSGVIAKDVDGPSAEPGKLDSENANFGKYNACLRVARTIFLGSAPTLHAAGHGLDEKRVLLGCVQPGESLPHFGDALRKLADRTTYLYVNGTRYWYNTAASVNRLATDLAERDEIRQQWRGEILSRLRKSTDGASARGDFHGIHVDPASSNNVPDDKRLRLVILPPEQSHRKDSQNSTAIQEADELLRLCGTSQRNYRNCLIFFAADSARVPELEEATRAYLAWKHIESNASTFDLTDSSKEQAKTRIAQFDRTIQQRLGETYVWILVPSQPDAPTSECVAVWQDLKANGANAAETPIGQRVGRKLRTERLLQTAYAGNELKLHLDSIPLWQGNHLDIAVLEDMLARYLYLPRLHSTDLLYEAIRSAVNQNIEGIAYAERFDEATGDYIGLRYNQLLPQHNPLTGFVVKFEAALAQTQREQEQRKNQGDDLIYDNIPQRGELSKESGENQDNLLSTAGIVTPDTAPRPKQLRRYHGSVTLNPRRMATEVPRVTEAVLQQLLSVYGSEVTVTIEIHATNPSGFPEKVVQNVSENSRTLKFETAGFEEE
jgi:predicted AAA+ superfamily ATPase